MALRRSLEGVHAQGPAVWAREHCQSTRTAVRFYAALGFEPRGEIEVPLPGGVRFPAVFMVAAL